MPQLVWRHRASHQGRTDFGRSARMLVEHIFEPGPRHGRTLRIDEHFCRTNVATHGQPCPQIGRRPFHPRMCVAIASGSTVIFRSCTT